MEFVLNTEAAPIDWSGLDDMARGFIEAAFFCDSSCLDSSEFFTPAGQERVREGQADGSIPEDAGVADLEPETFGQVAAFCAAFKARAAALLETAYAREYDESQAGRDLYFTYAGHGTGFWSRDALATEDSGEYERLTAAMVAAAQAGDDAAWNAACSDRSRIESLGQQLSEAAGRGEISLDAFESEDAPNGFRVSVYIG